MNDKIIKALQKLAYEVECLMNDLISNPSSADSIRESLEKSKEAARNAGIANWLINAITEPLEMELPDNYEVVVGISRDVDFVIIENEIDTGTKLEHQDRIKLEHELTPEPEHESTQKSEPASAPKPKKKKWWRKILKKIVEKTVAFFFVIESTLTKKIKRKTAAFIITTIVLLATGLMIIFPHKTIKKVTVVKKERIEVVVKKVISNATIDPLTISGGAGEIVEFHYDKNSCFYVSGNYESNAYPPSSEKVFFGFRTASGIEYRLADYITSYRFPSDGQIRFFVRIADEGNKVWSGASKNCSAKRLSEFKKSPIYITIKRIGKGKMESDDAEVAKIIIKTKTLKTITAYKEQDKKVEEAAKIIRSTLKKGYAYIFDQPLTIEKKPKTKEMK